jgi:hypothetical protein
MGCFNTSKCESNVVFLQTSVEYSRKMRSSAERDKNEELEHILQSSTFTENVGLFPENLLELPELSLELYRQKYKELSKYLGVK